MEFKVSGASCLLYAILFLKQRSNVLLIQSSTEGGIREFSVLQDNLFNNESCPFEFITCGNAFPSPDIPPVVLRLKYSPHVQSCIYLALFLHNQENSFVRES